MPRTIVYVERVQLDGAQKLTWTQRLEFVHDASDELGEAFSGLASASKTSGAEVAHLVREVARRARGIEPKA